MKRLLPPLFALVAVVACAVGKAKPLPIQTAVVSRRDVTITADANGVIEPIVIVEIKSKASGMLMKLNVEIGSYVKTGDTLARIDTRDVQSKLDQAKAAYAAAEAALQVAKVQKERSDALLQAKVITPTENEGARLTYENAQSQLVNNKAAVDLAQLSYDDATVMAQTLGTIIEKDVAEGQIIQSSTTSAGTGTTLLKMADLTKVRMRSYFNETDIGMIYPGEAATVTVDAYPDRRFEGKVEKIEPQALVQQGVTMFSVLINLENKDGALLPGMNGEVSALVDQRTNVIAVTNDAIKTQREGPAIAPLLGISADSFNTMMRQQTAARGGGGGRGRGAGVQQGEVDLAAQAGATPSAQPQGGAPRGGGLVAQGGNQQGGGGQGQGRGGGRGPQVQVTDQDCAAVTAAYAKHPKEKAALDSTRAKMRDPNADRAALSAQVQALYTKIGVDGPKAGACQRREMAAAGGGAGRGAGGGGGAGGGRRNAQPRGLAVQGGDQAEKPQSQRQTNHPGLVFVVDSATGPAQTYKPRLVMLGPGNLDYTEVISGLNEGDRVVLLNVLALQAQRQQQLDRQKANANPLGGNPGGGRGPGGPGGGGPPPGGGRGGF